MAYNATYDSAGIPSASIDGIINGIIFFGSIIAVVVIIYLAKYFYKTYKGR